MLVLERELACHFGTGKDYCWTEFSHEWHDHVWNDFSKVNRGNDGRFAFYNYPLSEPKVITDNSTNF